MPEDFDIKARDRISAFRNSHRSTVEQLKTKTEMPLYYEIYEALKKVTANEERRLSPDELGDLLEEKGKLVINRATGIF